MFIFVSKDEIIEIVMFKTYYELQLFNLISLGGLCHFKSVLPFIILKNSIRSPLRRLFSRDGKFNANNLSVYVSPFNSGILVARRWIFSIDLTDAH